MLLTLSFACCIFALYAQQRATSYIQGVPENATDIAGIPLVGVTEDERGAVITLGSSDRPVSVRLLEPISRSRLESILIAVDQASLLPGTSSGPGWSLSISELDINVGSGQSSLIVAQIEEYSVRLNDEALLLFSRRLSVPSSFRYDSETGTLHAELEFDGILTIDDVDEAFRGWSEVSDELRSWATEGLDSNDQRVMGAVLEIRVLSPLEAEEEKQGVVTAGSREDTWARLAVSALAESGNIVRFSADGIAAGVSSVLIQSTAGWEFVGLGRSPEVAPLTVALGIGPFADVGFACLVSCSEPRATEWLGAGIALTAGYSRVSPNIVNGVVEEPLLAIGLELQTRINIAAIVARSRDTVSPLAESEYFLTGSMMGVIAPLLQAAYRPELLVGPQFRVLPNLNVGGMALYSMGFGIGFRLHFDIRDYTRTNDRPEQ